MPSATLAGREIESALIVWASSPAAFARKIAAMRELGDFVLVPRPTQRIEDDYLDTADGRLGSRRIALRVRHVDGAARIAVKAPPPKGRAGPNERLEIDRPWSPAAAGRILRTLTELGTPLARRTGSRAWRGPDDFVAALNLVSVQRRATRREPRDVLVRGERSRTPLAELAIDTVTYSIGKQRVRLCEIEVEAKREEGVTTVRALPVLLLEHWQDELRVWRHSKLSTGKALQALDREGKLAAMLAPGGWLKPGAREKLERRLEKGAS
ncbi:MAG TPA: CYTH domain-containing protein [Candidatus Limnocylindria bacterium]|nr:CYTH domain-containing protein [Candidatus Limnocylindria bacterium]